MTNKNPAIHEEISLEEVLRSPFGIKFGEEVKIAFEKQRAEQAIALCKYLQKHPYPLLVRAYS